MTREEAKARWAQICETVFWAEDRIKEEWWPKLKATKGKTTEEITAVAHEYYRALAEEIVKATPEEELKPLP